jgi:protein arginine N-methyltransferase 1
MRQFYGVDMSCLDDRYRREQKEYYLETSAWADVHPSQMLGPPSTLKEYDLLTVTLEEIAEPLRVSLSSLFTQAHLQGVLCG